MLDLFRKLHEQGTTIIVVTHDALVASCAQRERQTALAKHGQHAHGGLQRVGSGIVPQNGIGLQQRGGIGAAGGAAGSAQLIHCRCILRGKQLRVEHIKIGFGHQ